jgi:hypothetical protein
MRNDRFYLLTIQRRYWRDGQFNVDNVTTVTDCNLVAFITAEKRLKRETCILYAMEITAEEYEYYYTHID